MHKLQENINKHGHFDGVSDETLRVLNSILDRFDLSGLYPQLRIRSFDNEYGDEPGSLFLFIREKPDGGGKAAEIDFFVPRKEYDTDVEPNEGKWVVSFSAGNMDDGSGSHFMNEEIPYEDFTEVPEWFLSHFSSES